MNYAWARDHEITNIYNFMGLAHSGPLLIIFENYIYVHLYLRNK